jgi:2-desacetyl-2-hydroxyethyl bacteriochlorophyllide A dehydrogenase
MNETYPMAMVKTPGKVEFEDRSVPELSAGQVLIKTRAVSICGSDVHTFKGKHPFAPLPAALGHELAGEIAGVGEKVDRLQIGDRVVLEPVIFCGSCEFCLKGLYNLCAHVSFYHRQGQGAFTPYFVADQQRVFKLPDNVTFEEGALVEPLAVAVHAVKKAGIKMGDYVTVFGVGAVGLMILILSRLQGAASVFAVDVHDFRLEKAKAFGAAGTFNNTDGKAVAQIIDRTGGSGVEVSFEAVGIQPTFVQALQVLKKGGHAVVVGLNAEPEVTLPANIFVQKEISLSGSQGYCHDFQTALALLENGAVDLSPFITHTLTSDAIQEGFDLLTTPGNETVKIVVVYNQGD